MKFKLHYYLCFCLTLLLLLTTTVQAKSLFYFYLQNQTGNKIEIWENGRFNIFYSGITTDNSRIRILPEDKNAVIEYTITYCDNSILPCGTYKEACVINFQNFVENNQSAIKTTITPLTSKMQCNIINYDTIVLSSSK